MAGDFDGDGRSDLIIGTAAASGVQGVRSLFVSWNRGGVDLAVPEPLLEINRSIRCIDSVDLDGDGDLDLLFVTFGPGVESWINDGHGSFTLGVISDVAVDDSVHDVGIVDVDQDGILDVVLHFGPGGGATTAVTDVWIRRDASGQLSDAVPLLAGDFRSGRMRLVDIDGDGDLDVVAMRIATLQPGLSRPLAWFENTAGFPIAVQTFQPLLGNSASTIDVVPLDADMDGDFDLVVSVQLMGGVGRLRVMPNQGGGVFGATIDYTLAALPDQLQLADINGDGATDLVYVEQNYPTAPVYVQLNDGTGSFSARERITRGELPIPPFVVADLDGDALPEIIEPTRNGFWGSPFRSSGVRLYHNLTASGGVGDDRFAPPSDVTESLGEGPIAAADFNQDGRPDLLVHRSRGPSYAAVKLNDGGGRYLDGFKIADMAAVPGTTQEGATMGDIDGDGLLDVAFVEPIGAGASAQIGAVFGDGQGQFSSVVTLAAWPLDTDFVELHDLDADGDPDLIGAHAGGTQILYGLNDGTGGFGAPVSLGAPFSAAVQFEVVDLDQDAVVDILTVAGDRAESFRGLGAGLFGPKTLSAQLPWDAETFATGDFDGDGQSDLAALEIPDPFVSTVRHMAVYLGSAGGGFSALPVLTEADIRTNMLRALDVDANGRDDLVVLASYGFGGARFLKSMGDGTFAADQAIDLGGRVTLNLAAVDADQDGDMDLVFGAGHAAELVVVLNESLTDIGSPYCVFALPNSTGAVGEIEGYGGTEVFRQQLELTVVDLPTNVTGFFLISRTDAVVLGVPGSMGVLCLGGDIGRFVGPGQVQHSGPDGTFLLDVNLMAVPTPMGAMSVLPGDTWNFQAWHRDTDGSGQPTSNFSDALALTFR